MDSTFCITFLKVDDTKKVHPNRYLKMMKDSCIKLWEKMIEYSMHQYYYKCIVNI